MAKRVHELAAELGMRSERLMDLLQREGLRVESALDELDSRTALRIRRELESGRSRWSRVKTSLGRRMGVSRLPSAASLSDEEEEELEELVSRQEDRERPAHVGLELDEAETPLREKTVQPGQEGAKVGAVEGPSEKRGGLLQGAGDLSREPKASSPFTPAPVEEETFEAPEKPSFDEEPVLSEAEEDLSAGTQEKALEEESLLATLDRIAQMEEANGRSREEPPPEDLRLEEEPETRVDQEGAPTAKKEHRPPVEDAQEDETYFSADELLEQQLAAARAPDEQEEPAEGWHGHPAHVGKAAAAEEVTEDIFEETSDEVPEEVPEAQAPREITPEPERQEVETRRASDLSPAGEESETVTIDELLGTPMPEEQPAASEENVAEAKGEVSEEELLDTESLLGLEFVEQAEAPPSSGSAAQAEEKEAEGVRVEELLGVPEAEPPGMAERLSPLVQRLQALLLNLRGRVGAVMRDPAAFLRSLSNLELVVVSLAFLLTLSGAFYAFYRWYNFNRPGMDERFFLWGEQLCKVGGYEEAIEKYQLVLKYHPDSERVKPACFGLADARYRLGQFREAIPAYERALALYEQSGSEGLSVEGFPDFLVVPRARLNLARSMLQVGFYERAKEELVELAARFPGEEIGEESRMLLGDLYMHWAREENRPEKYQNAVSEYHLALGEYPGSRRGVELRRCLGDAYRALYEAQAEGQQDRQLLQEACEQYEKAARMAKEEERPPEEVARLHVAWADTQRQLGATRSAIEAYDRVLGTGLPMDLQVEVLEKIARSYLELEDFEQAERWAQELVGHNPDDAGRALAYYVFGDAEWERQENRDYTRMMQAYQQALRLDEQSGPDAAHSQRAYMRMTYVLYQMHHDYEEAAGKYRTIIEKYPDGLYTYRAKFFLAECLENLGRHVEAADAYGRVIEDYATTVHVSPAYYRDALYRRGDCLLAGGQAPEAVRAYQSVLQELGFPETPEAVAVRERLAEAYLALGDYPQAEKILLNLREKFPEVDRDGGVSLKLADVREGLFDYEGAREIYLELVERSRDQETVRTALARLAQSYLAQLAGAEPQEADALRLAAASTYEAMRKRIPEARSAELEAGRLYYELGDRGRAAGHLERFLKAAGAEEPQVEAAALLGEMAWEEGRTDEAVMHLRRIEQLPSVPGDAPWRARGHYLLAECYRQRQELAEAKAEYTSVLTEFPDSPWAKEAAWKLENVDWQLQLSQIEAVTSL